MTSMQTSTPKTSAGLRKWRSEQPRGAIVKPATFSKIVSDAEKRGLSPEDAKKEAGAAYWGSAQSQYEKKLRSSRYKKK